eukprot:IDg3179t1
MTLQCLQLLKKCAVELHAIPAHTSGTTQPPDVSVFSPFKRRINEHTSSLSKEEGSKIDLYNMCCAFNDAYTDTFSRSNIKGGFDKTGLWPLNSKRLLSRPLPLTYDDIDTVVQVEDLCKRVQDIRRGRRAGVSMRDDSVRSGYLDTRYGCHLTSTAALSATKRLYKKKRLKKLTTLQKAAHMIAFD